jgi:tRNA-specific adenosine deaminase 2
MVGVPSFSTMATPADVPENGYVDDFMQEALKEARQALASGEVPVGCVFVRDNVIIARGHNRTNARLNALEHAELVALAARPPQDSAYSLEGVHLYVTVEPCIMCGAALLYRQVDRVFFGCANPRFGGNGSILALNSDRAMEDRAYDSFGGHRAEEAVALLQNFYAQENPGAPEDKRCRKEERALLD